MLVKMRYITLQVPQIAPNHTIEHLNFKNFPGKDASGPPYMLASYSVWAIKGLPSASKPSPTLI